MSAQQDLPLPSPAASNAVMINARCSLRIEADQRAIVVAGLPVHRYCALWIETINPGKPLGFLDANIRCGDSLLGVFDMAALVKGIPEAAYKPLTGDDKPTARYYATRNRTEQKGQSDLFLHGGKLPAAAPLAQARAALRGLPEESPEEIAEKRRRFARADRLSYVWREAADLYMGARRHLSSEPLAPPPTWADHRSSAAGRRRALANKQVHPPWWLARRRFRGRHEPFTGRWNSRM